MEQAVHSCFNSSTVQYCLNSPIWGVMGLNRLITNCSNSNSSSSGSNSSSNSGSSNGHRSDINLVVARAFSLIGGVCCGYAIRKTTLSVRSSSQALLCDLKKGQKKKEKKEKKEEMKKQQQQYYYYPWYHYYKKDDRQNTTSTNKHSASGDGFSYLYSMGVFSAINIYTWADPQDRNNATLSLVMATITSGYFMGGLSTTATATTKKAKSINDDDKEEEEECSADTTTTATNTTNSNLSSIQHNNDTTNTHENNNRTAEQIHRTGTILCISALLLSHPWCHFHPLLFDISGGGDNKKNGFSSWWITTRIRQVTNTEAYASLSTMSDIFTIGTTLLLLL